MKGVEGTFSVCSVNVASGLPSITVPLGGRAAWLPCLWDEVQSRNREVRGIQGALGDFLSALSAHTHVPNTRELAGQGSQPVAKEGQLVTPGENTGQLPGFALTTYLVPGRLCGRNHRA